MNTITKPQESTLFEDLKRVSLEVDDWPEWKQNSLRCSSDDFHYESKHSHNGQNTSNSKVES